MHLSAIQTHNGSIQPQLVIVEVNLLPKDLEHFNIITMVLIT